MVVPDLLYFLDGIPDNGKEERNVFLVEPPRPIRKRDYFCDKYFHIELIEELFETYDDYGVIDIQGEDTTFYILSGDSLNYLTKINADLPSNHDQGGQSQNRIQRLRKEKIHNYLKKINDLACSKWIIPQTEISTEEITIKGLIISGTANKKDEFLRDKILDFRLEKILLGVVVKPEINILKSLIYKDEIKRNLELYQNEVEKNILNNPERLIFGKDIYNRLQNKMVKLLIINQSWIDMKKTHVNYNLFQNEIDNNNSIKVIIIPNYDPLNVQIDLYGGIIGVEW